MTKRIWIIGFLLIMIMPSPAQEKDALIIYGQGWMFGVVEPKGWRCHTEDAHQHHMNAYFCLGKKKIDNSPAIMHISVYSKGGDTVQQSLAHDIENYKKHSKTLELQDFQLEANWEIASAKYIIDDKTTDYVCFVDPGKNSQFYLVLVLHGAKEESPKYESDFLSLIKSLHWMSGKSGIGL